MDKIVQVKNQKARVLKAKRLKTLEDFRIEGNFQAVIVHADKFETFGELTDFERLKEQLYEDRLIEARFFSPKEEHRLLRINENNKTVFLYRHIRDGIEQDADYTRYVDTSAEYYKRTGTVLKIRNYIAKRGLLNSYDDMRFVELKGKMS